MAFFTDNESRAFDLFFENILSNYNTDLLECELRGGLDNEEFGGKANLIDSSTYRKLLEFYNKNPIAELENENVTTLDIFFQSRDLKNVRYSLLKKDEINKFCNTNTLPEFPSPFNKKNIELFETKVKIIYKHDLSWSGTDTSEMESFEGYLQPTDKAKVDLKSIRSRIGGKIEMPYEYSTKKFNTDNIQINLDNTARDLGSQVNTTKKTFRLKNRTSYIINKNDITYRIDLTTVKSTVKPSYKLIDSGISQQVTKYEYEIEILNHKDIGNRVDNIKDFINVVYLPSFEYSSLFPSYTSRITELEVKEIYLLYIQTIMKKRIEYNLECLKDARKYLTDTSDPDNINKKYSKYNVFHKYKSSPGTIASEEKKLSALLQTYTTSTPDDLLHKKHNGIQFSPYISPKVVSIEVQDIRDQPLSITNEYTVTDKADGYNMLLFKISSNEGKEEYRNRLYLIDDSLRVYDTKLTCKKNSGYHLYNGEYLPVCASVIPGEKRIPLNKYGIFDCYMYDDVDTCQLPLVSVDESESETRLKKVELFIETDKPIVNNFTPSEYLSEDDRLIQLHNRSSLEEGEISEDDPDDEKLRIEVDQYGNKYIVNTGTRVFVTPEMKMEANGTNFDIFKKKFEYLPSDSIFKHSNHIWSKWKHRIINYEEIGRIYHLDGLIYTNMNYPVGYDDTAEYMLKQSNTWNSNKKWKPPEDNTIDFLIQFDKEVVNDKDGNPISYKGTQLLRNKTETIVTVSPEGNKISKRYLIGLLYNGGHLENKMPCDRQKKTRGKYGPVLFDPPHPKVESIHKIYLPIDTANSLKDITKDQFNEPVESDTIVEISYTNFNPDEPDFEPNPNLRWKVLNTRLDKTYVYKNALSEQAEIDKLEKTIYMNDLSMDIQVDQLKEIFKSAIDVRINRRTRKAYIQFDTKQDAIESFNTHRGTFSLFHPRSKTVNIKYGNFNKVAHNIWETIHNPITTEMITTGNDIPDILDEEEKYYNKYNNIYRNRNCSMKQLQNFHNRIVKNKTLLKSVSTLLKDVQDISLLDLGCGKGGDIGKWVDNNISTVVGVDKSSDNIHNRDNGACVRRNFYENKGKGITNIDFFVGDVINLDFAEHSSTRETFNSSTWKSHKFNIISIMFAIHYFFKDEDTLTALLENINNSLDDNGYLIGSCFNGKTIFDKFKEDKKRFNDDIVGTDKGNVSWKIVKKYHNEEFNELGMTIQVFICTIGKYINEYLVNFDLLIDRLKVYNIHPIPSNELKTIGLSKAIDSFKGIYTDDSNMKNYEKELSFMNSYFIFKKYPKGESPE